MEPKISHCHKTFRQYALELGSAFALYALFLCVSISVGRFMHPSIGRTLLLVSPMAPAFLMVFVIMRQFRRMDEYLRLQTLESIVVAAAVTACWTFTYGFLENAGFPRLSMFTVWPVMGAVWATAAIIRGLATR